MRPSRGEGVLDERGERGGTEEGQARVGEGEVAGVGLRGDERFVAEEGIFRPSSF